jgi:calcineurin-like phosphoesterase family protein
MYYFIADEHFGHFNAIKYCGRPFATVDEMDEAIVDNHNSVVSKNDTVIHVGDFTLINNTEEVYKKYISRLNGNHTFVMGSHDKWLKPSVARDIWQSKINGQYIVACHYSMRVWPRSHYNSWLVYGHSHGKLTAEGKSWDVGVDCNNFFPVSFNQLKVIMDSRPDNFNLVRKP